MTNMTLVGIATMAGVSLLAYGGFRLMLWLLVPRIGWSNHDRGEPK